MVTKTLTIEVPEGAAFDDIEQLVADELEERIRKTARNVELQQVLESDEALDRWLKKEYYMFTGSPLPPVVRASAYEKVYFRFQELFPFEHRNDPRRPVIMRGSLFCMKNKPLLKSQLHEDILARFIRYKKMTAYTFEEFNQQIGGARKKLWGRGILNYRNRYNYWDFGHSDGADEVQILVGGEWRYLPVAQYAEVMKYRDIRLAKAAEKASREAKARAQWLDFMLRKQTAKTAKTAKTAEMADKRKAQKARELAALELLAEAKII